MNAPSRQRAPLSSRRRRADRRWEEHLLVIDDERDSREGLARLLRLSGFQVRTTADAKEALEALREHAFDAVISDVNIPGLDGYQLTAHLRAAPETKDIPILLVSAIAHPERQVRGLEGGADDFIAKPIDFDLLVAKLRARLRRAQEREHLRDLSATDDLTGIPNRRGIEEELHHEIARAQRTDSGVSVIVVDVDDFKRINDTWGHAAGDEALKVVVDTLQRLLRATDRIGRTGGDEFLIVLPDTKSEVDLLEKRIRHHFAKHPPRPGDTPTLVRVSLGSATVDPRRDPTGAEAIARADAAMYEDKRR